MRAGSYMQGCGVGTCQKRYCAPRPGRSEALEAAMLSHLLDAAHGAGCQCPECADIPGFVRTGQMTLQHVGVNPRSVIDEDAVMRRIRESAFRGERLVPTGPKDAWFVPVPYGPPAPQKVFGVTARRQRVDPAPGRIFDPPKPKRPTLREAPRSRNVIDPGTKSSAQARPGGSPRLPPQWGEPAQAHSGRVLVAMAMRRCTDPRIIGDLDQLFSRYVNELLRMGDAAGAYSRLRAAVHQICPPTVSASPAGQYRYWGIR